MFFIVLGMITGGFGAQAANVTDFGALLVNDLMTPKTGLPYSKAVMPPPCPMNATDCEPNRPLIIQSRLFLIRVHDLVESSETLITSVRLQLGWNDSRLTWDPDNYGGISTIIIPGGTLWTPDLQLANSIDDAYVLAKDEMFNFKLSYNGEVWWHPTAKVSSRCKLVRMP